MSSALSVFAQKLNIGSPKPPRPHTSRKPSLARRDGVEIRTPGTPAHRFDSPSDLRSSEIPQDIFPRSLQQFVDRDGASPSIVYSSPSCLSTADLSTPSFSPLTDRAASSLSGITDGFLSSSPHASPSSLSSELASEEVTLAQRRGVRRLLSLRSSRNSNVTDRSPPRPKSPFASLSPLSPRFTLNLLHAADLDSPDDKFFDNRYEDAFDPFSRASPSVFYTDSGRPSHEPTVDSWLSRPEAFSETDDPEVQAQSPLSDLSVYLCRPPQPHADTPSNAKSRLHIWVSGIELQSPTTGVNQPRILSRCSTRKNRKPKLRPLILPNLAALREIANAQQQQESTVSHTCPLRTVAPQQQQDGPHLAASSESASAGLVRGQLAASPLPPPELVTSAGAFPVALGSGHARRLSRESTSEPVIMRRDGDGNVGAAPQQADGEAPLLSHPQCHCSVPVPSGCERAPPSQDQNSEAEEPSRLKHGHEGETLRRLNGRNCDKPLPEEPQDLDKDKPLPRDPLEKPLPQVPSEDRLDGLIALLHQAGVITDVESAQSLRALAWHAGLVATPRRRLFLRRCCS